jgi:hypothetical protein
MENKKLRTIVMSAVLALVVVVVAYMIFFAPPRAVANITLQVNPAVTLDLSNRNIVIEARGLDAGGESLLAGVNVTGMEASEALLMIADALRQAGLLEDGRQIRMAVSGQIREAELTVLMSAAEQTIRGYLTEQNLTADVVIVLLTTELADAIRVAGLLPVDYVDSVIEVGSPAVLAMLGMQEELVIDPVLFKEEFSTIASALADMKEAGITEENALAILRGALMTDSSLEELTTITSAMIDLHEVGATQESIMAVFDLAEGQLAAGVDRTLLLEEFTTITAAKADLIEAGISETAALDTLRTAMQADTTMEELTTITAMMIDLVVDERLSKEEALNRIQSAIREDPTLEKFDDLVEDGLQNRRPDRPRPPSPPRAPQENQYEENQATPVGNQRNMRQPVGPPQFPNGYLD